MRKSEKIPHIHLSLVSQSGFKAKVNVLTFGKLQDDFFVVFFSTFSVLYNDYNIRQKKKKKKFRTCFISVQRTKNRFP